MTYAQFHVAYTLPALLAVWLLQTRPLAGVGAGVALRWLAGVAGLAIVYTTPWDNYLVYRGVWGYPAGAVAATIGYVPVEEYAFFVIQTGIVGGLYFALRGRRIADSPAEPMPPLFRTSGVVAWLVLTVAGIGFLVWPDDHALYLGLILAWAPPVLAGIWAVGAPKLWDERRRLVWSVAVPTVYLWMIDRIAIGRGVWDIRDATKLGFDPLGLPVEEALFFLLTTVLCATGLVLLMPSATRDG